MKKDKEPDKKEEKKNGEKDEKKDSKKEKVKINLPKIEEFIQKIEIKKTSPSLEKINVEEKNVNLERSLANVSTPKNKEDEEIFNYSKSRKSKEEPKYTNFGNQPNQQYSLRENLEQLGKKDFSENREVAFMPSTEVRGQKSLEQDYVSVEKFDREKLGSEEFSRKKDIKYEVKF